MIFLAMLCLRAVSGISQHAGHGNLPETITFFERKEGVTFAYDPDLLAHINHQFDTANVTLQSFVAQVESSLPLTIRAVDNRYYIVSTTSANYRLTLADSVTGTYISDTPGTAVLLNGQPLPGTIGQHELVFSYQPELADTLEVYVPGYSPVQISIHKLLNEQQFTVQLNVPTVHLAKILIEDYLTAGIDLNPASQHISIKLADLPLLPGETDGDLFASLAALPGVTTPDNRAGNLFIRGSSTDQSLVLFDNIPIYHRGHYFGTISPYNPKVVEEVKVYRNGYHPRFGGRAGGAVEISSARQPAQNPTTGVGTNSLYAMGFTKLPLAGKKMGVSIGARRSYPYSFSSPKLRSISEMVFAASALVDSSGRLREDIDVVFEDYHGRITLEANRKNAFYFTSIFTRSKTAFSVNLPEENNVKNAGFNLGWDRHIGERMHSQLSVTWSDYAYSYRIGSAQSNPPPGHAINDIQDFNIREELNVNFNSTNEMQLGVDYHFQQTGFDYNAGSPRDSLPVLLARQAEAHTFSPFANFELNSLEKFYLQLGIRATAYSLAKEFNVTPRIFANYYPNRALTLKTSLGWYRQYLSQVKTLEFSSGGFDNELWLLTESGDGIISGAQAMVGGIVSAKSWIFDLETYHKTAANVTYYNNKKFSNTRGAYFTADHQMYGADFFAKKRVSERVSLWAGYSWSQSLVVLDSATYDSKYSQPHVYYLGGVIHKNHFKLSAGWKYGSGLNARSLDMIQQENMFLNGRASAPPGAPRPANPFASLPARYAAVHMLDLSASYAIPRTEARKWSSTIGLSLINLYNQVNLTDKVTRAGFPAPFIEDRHAMQFAPNLMIMVEW